MNARRPASALLATIIAVVLLEALLVGLVVVAMHEIAAVRSYEDALRARLAAQSGLSVTLGRWPRDVIAALPIWGATHDSGAVRTGAGAADSAAVTLGAGARGGWAVHTSTVERLTSELYLVRSVGRVDAPRPAHSTLAALVRTLPRDTLARLVHAALIAGGPVEVTESATVHGEIATGTTEPCVGGFSDAAPPWPAPALVTSEPDAVSLAPGSLLEGPVSLDPARVMNPLAVFEQLLGAPLAELADRSERDAVIALPVVDGDRCDTDASGNWGDPRYQGTPCARYAPLIHADGDLRVVAGAGQGILVVAGDLVIDQAARFVGIAFAGGRAELHGELLGALVTGAGPALISGSIRFDRCAVTRALALAPALARRTAPAGRWWLPAW